MDAAELATGLREGTIEIRRSARRKKTISSQQVGERIVLSVPSRFDVNANAHRLAALVTKLERSAARRRSSDVDLEARAEYLADRYLSESGAPRSIRWVSNQNTLWGSTTTGTRDIRLSHRLQVMPPWVVDSVIVHELAHLVVPDHSAAFQALVHRYPEYERAQAFLAGFTLGQATPASEGAS